MHVFPNQGRRSPYCLRRPFRHRLATLVLLAVPLLWSVDTARCDSDGQKSRAPNIVFILADDLGYGDVSCFGGEDLETPNIDNLAKRGMRLTQFYANCTVCSPTRAAVLTGRFPDMVGVPGVIRTHSKNSWGYFDPAAPTMPAVLAEAGYDTAAIGKWHLGLAKPNLPTARGFGFFHGFLGDMMDDYWTHLRHGRPYMMCNETPVDPKGHATEIFTDWAREYLKSRDQGKPFFLYLAYNAPHFPIQPPTEWLSRYKTRHPEAPERRAKNCAFVEHFDAGVGRVLKTLAETGLAENTLVIFTSDNGGALHHAQSNRPFRDGKQSHYEGGIRVPTIAAWPGRVKEGVSTEAVGLSMDVFPTACELAGIDPPAGLDGRSLVPVLLQGETPKRRGPLFWTRLEGGRRYQGRAYYAVRDGDWKLLQNTADAPFELYNIADDPGEKTNRAEDRPEIVARLKRLLDDHVAATAKVPWRLPDGRGPGEVDPPNPAWTERAGR